MNQQLPHEMSRAHHAKCPMCKQLVEWIRGERPGSHWYVNMPKSIIVPGLRNRRPDYHGCWCPVKRQAFKAYLDEKEEKIML